MLSSLRIGPRLAAGFGLMILLILLMAAVGSRGMAAIDAHMLRIVNRYNAQERLVAEVATQIRRIDREVRTITLLSLQGQPVEASLEEVARARKSHEEANRKLGEMLVSEEARRYFKEMADLTDQARTLNNAILDAARAKDAKLALGLILGDARSASERLLGASDRFQDFLRDQGDMQARGAEEEYRSGRTQLFLAALVAILLGLAMAWAFTRSITRPLAAFGQVLDRVAACDLRAVAETAGRDELAALGRSLNTTVGQLREAFSGVQDGTYAIAQASAEIATGNSDLSARTEEQAASLQETASSMEEFASTITHTAESARSAAQSASAARDAAEQGNAAVRRLVKAMEEIDASSSRIAEIIAVVDDIAFQTNLLALNAAVEAARAGEQGRGFAVVAAEVRTLARRSAEAAKEIKALIRESVQRAQEGHQGAAQTGEMIQSVAADVKRVSDIIHDIAGAAREQTLGIHEINKAVLQMDEVTQQNAALVEQAAAAAENLDEQARSLAEIVARFQTGRAHQPQAAPASRSKAPVPKVRRPASALKFKQVAQGELITSKPPVALPPEEDGLWESF